jgi:hypothetical protein
MPVVLINQLFFGVQNSTLAGHEVRQFSYAFNLTLYPLPFMQKNRRGTGKAYAFGSARQYYCPGRSVLHWDRYDTIRRHEKTMSEVLDDCMT